MPIHDRQISTRGVEVRLGIAKQLREGLRLLLSQNIEHRVGGTDEIIAHDVQVSPTRRSQIRADWRELEIADLLAGQRSSRTQPFLKAT